MRRAPLGLIALIVSTAVTITGLPIAGAQADAGAPTALPPGPPPTLQAESGLVAPEVGSADPVDLTALAPDATRFRLVPASDGSDGTELEALVDGDWTS